MTVQYGYGMPVFVGRRIQRGYGLGGVFGSLAKSMLLPVAKRVGTELLASGLKRATQAVENFGKGKPLKDSFVEQFSPSSLAKAGVKRTASALNILGGSPSKKNKD